MLTLYLSFWPHPRQTQHRRKHDGYDHTRYKYDRAYRPTQRGWFRLGCTRNHTDDKRDGTDD